MKLMKNGNPSGGGNVVFAMGADKNDHDFRFQHQRKASLLRFEEMKFTCFGCETM